MSTYTITTFTHMGDRWAALVRDEHGTAIGEAALCRSEQDAAIFAVTNAFADRHHRPLLRVQSIVMTCGACPSQWEGQFADGRYFYARYRWGQLSVSVSTESVDAAVGGEEIFAAECGDGLDGHMTTERMMEITGMAPA